MKTNKSIAILLGEKNCGKTEFSRKICQINKEMKEQQLIPTAFRNKFLVMDTNGFKSQNEILPTLARLLPVSSHPLNVILLMIKYRALSEMKKELEYELKVLNPYQQILILIISHWDFAKQKGEEIEKQKIKNEIIEPLKLKNYLFSDLNSEGEAICKQIDTIITKIDLLKKNELMLLKNQNSEDEIDTVDIESKFQENCEGACNLIDELINNIEIDLIEQMHELCLAIIDEVNLKMMEFTELHSQVFGQLLEKYGICQYTYLSYTKLKINLMNRANQVIQKAQTSRSNLNLPLGDNIKQCYNCGLIWVNQYDCPYVICGIPLSNFDKLEQTRLRRYKFTFVGTNVEMVKLDNVPSIQQLDKSKILLKGCGVSLNWDQLPTLSQEQQKQLEQELFIDPILCALVEQQEQLQQEVFNNPEIESQDDQQYIQQPLDLPQKNEQSCCSKCMIY